VTDGPDEFDSTTRMATPEEEKEALHYLGHLFEIIDQWQATDLQRGVLSAPAGSSLAADDQATNPYHVSHNVMHELAGAFDHLHALRMLVQTAQALHTFAPFTLNRAAMECGAAAVWVLAPKSRDERIRRRLVLATRNARDIDSARMQLLGEPSSLRSRLDDIRKVAARRPALDPTGIVGTPPSIERIISEAADTFQLHTDEAVMMWKLCSGITHNRLWATLNLLDREELGRVGNVRDVHVSASLRNVLAATTVSVWFSTEARRLFALRTAPSQ
jgi:hypothetical protein